MKRLKGFSSERSFFEMPFLICDVTLALDEIAHTSMKSQFRFSAMHTLELYKIRHKNISQLAVYRYIAHIFFPVAVPQTISPEQKSNTQLSSIMTF